VIDSHAHEGHDTRPSLIRHPDSRGIFVELWVIDLMEGDLPSALLFRQLLWWHQPAKDGTWKLRYERYGHRWLLRADDDWWEDTRLTQKQVRRVRSRLLAMALIEHRRFKLEGAPTSAWRPVFEAIQAARSDESGPKCPISELPSQGQFHGSDPIGAVPSALTGAVPIPLEVEVEPKEPIEVVFAAWKSSTGRNDRTILDPKRRRLIVSALASYPLVDVLDAVRGWEHSPHHRGENDAGRPYNDLGLLLRDAEHIEQFRDAARGPRRERTALARPKPERATDAVYRRMGIRP